MRCGLLARTPALISQWPKRRLSSEAKTALCFARDTGLVHPETYFRSGTQPYSTAYV